MFPSGAERRSTHGARRRSLAGLAPPRSSTARPSPPAPTRAPDVPDAPTPPPKPPASGPPAIHGSPPRTSPGPAPNAGTRAPARAATPACQSPSHARKPPAPSARRPPPAESAPPAAAGTAPTDLQRRPDPLPPNILYHPTSRERPPCLPVFNNQRTDPLGPRRDVTGARRCRPAYPAATAPPPRRGCSPYGPSQAFQSGRSLGSRPRRSSASAGSDRRAPTADRCPSSP